MAQRVETFLVDDLDGSEAADTVLFGLDGAHYEIDLNADHAGDLRAALTCYIDAGRKVAGVTPSRRGTRNTRRSAGKADARAWARAHGIAVKDRGRIPADVVARYQADTDG